VIECRACFLCLTLSVLAALSISFPSPERILLGASLHTIIPHIISYSSIIMSTDTETRKVKKPSSDVDEKDEGVAAPNEAAQEAANDAATGLGPAAEGEGAGAGDGQPVEFPRFSVDILANIKAAQLQNGLRHGDYQRYRQYCTRRLRRLRVGLHFTYGKREFKPRPLTSDVVSDARHLLLPLVNAERSWGYAMQLKNDMTAETQRKRFHLIKRLTKAAQSAAQLKELCAARADTRTQLQAEAYAAWMEGSVRFERNQHDRALANFLHAKTVYEKLGSIGGSSMQLLCEERVASLADSIRFCRYMLRGRAEGSELAEMELAASGNDLLAAKIEQLQQERVAEQAKTLDTIEWQGRTVPVSNEKLRMHFVEANNLREQLNMAMEDADKKTKEEDEKAAVASSNSPVNKDGGSDAPSNLSVLYQKLFSSYDDSLKIVRDALVEPKMLESHKQFLIHLQQYATWNRLEVQLLRLSTLIHSLVASLHEQERHPRQFQHRRKTKPDEVVLMYEKMNQALQELADIAAANKNQAQQRRLALRMQAAQLQRIFYLGESYRRIRKYLEAFLLYTRCIELIDEYVKTASNLSVDANADAADKLSEQTKYIKDELRTEAVTLRGVVHAQALLEEAEKAAKMQAGMEKLAIDEKRTSSQPLPARLDRWDGGEASSHHRLLDFPPELQPAPAKPILFDLAFNAIQYPQLDLDEATRGRTTVAEAKKEKATTQAPAKHAAAAAAKAAEPQRKPKQQQQQEQAAAAERRAREAERQREEEEEERAAAEAEAEAKKKQGGWGLGGLVGKMFGR